MNSTDKYVIASDENGFLVKTANDIIHIDWKDIKTYKSHFEKKLLVGLNLKFELMFLLHLGIKCERIYDIAVAENYKFDLEGKSMLLRKFDIDYFIKEYEGFKDIPSHVFKVSIEQTKYFKGIGNGEISNLKDKFSEYVGEVFTDYYGIKYNKDDYEILGGKY